MFIALDLETTGLDAQKDKIIEVAAIKIKPDGTIVDIFHSVVQPHVKLPQLIVHLTGITDEELEGAPVFDEIREPLQTFIGDAPILGHSVGFDVGFLEANGIQIRGKILDTFQLAQCLLPNEDSYSLEVLSEKYEITHESKHRADDDTKVAIELYKMLLEKIREIPTEFHEGILGILNKTDWGWAEPFKETLSESHTPSSPRNHARSDAHTPQTTPSTPLTELLTEALAHEASGLIEAPNAHNTDLVQTAAHHAEQSGDKPLVVLADHRNITPDPRVTKLFHPGQYLCLKQLDTALQKPNLTGTEAALLIKILMWKDSTETGIRHELKIGNREYGAWQQLSAHAHLYKSDETPGGSPADNDPNCFYKKALRNAHGKPVLVISPELLLENVVERGRLIPERSTVLLDHLEQFEQTALNTFTQYFHLDNFTAQTQLLERDDLENSLAILFGLVGIFIEKHADPDAFANQVILDETHGQTAEWQRIRDSLEGIQTQMDTLDAQSPVAENLKILFRRLTKSLQLNPATITWVMTRMDGSPLVRACPRQMNALIHQEIWNKFSTKLLVSPFGTLENEFTFLKERLGLDTELPEQLLEPTDSPTDAHPELILHDDLPRTSSPKNLNATRERIQSLIQDLPPDENVFLLTNSNKSTQQLHQQLANWMKAQNINLLSQGMSGGMGKITQLFEKSPTRVLLIGNQRLFSTIQKSSHAASIRTLLIQRLPFLPPSHPVHKAASDRCIDGFREYSLPMAILRFKRFLYEFTTRFQGRTIHLLDPRFDNYDGAFRKSMTPTIQIR